MSFRILLATCVRTVEFIKARWEHIDFDRTTWFAPDDSVKTQVGFRVPLTHTVLQWFKQLKLLAGGVSWVLLARTKWRRDYYISGKTLWAAITRAFEHGDIETRRVTPQDTRSTANGNMGNLVYHGKFRRSH
jgi:integrase